MLYFSYTLSFAAFLYPDLIYGILQQTRKNTWTTYRFLFGLNTGLTVLI